jgi:hypothetical protein
MVPEPSFAAFSGAGNVFSAAGHVPRLSSQNVFFCHCSGCLASSASLNSGVLSVSASDSLGKVSYTETSAYRPGTCCSQFLRGLWYFSLFSQSTLRLR